MKRPMTGDNPHHWTEIRFCCSHMRFRPGRRVVYCNRLPMPDVWRREFVLMRIELLSHAGNVNRWGEFNRYY